MKILSKNEGFTNLLSNLFTELNREVLIPNGLSTFGNVNIIEKEDQYQLDLSIPGVKKENVDISIDKNILILKVTNDETNEETNEKIIRKEFSYISFQRKFHLSDDVDKENIKATFNNGILTLNMFKNQKSKINAKKINID